MDFTSLTKFSPTEYTPDNKFRPTLPTFARKKNGPSFFMDEPLFKIISVYPRYSRSLRRIAGWRRRLKA